MSNKQFNLNAGYIDKADDSLFYGLIIHRNLKTSQLNLTGTAALIISSALSGRILLFVVNNSLDIIYLGGDNTVTTANGFPLFPRQSIILTIEDNVSVWGISEGTSSDIRMIEGS